jgi:capsular polysaccharide biosynthesis protein
MADVYKTEEEQQTILGGIDFDIFKYDVRVFLISLYRRLPFLLLIPVSVMGLTVAYVYSQPKQWKSTCILFKSVQEDSERENKLSTLRKPLSAEVIKEMVRSKSNMRAVTKNLKLPMTVESLYGATEVTVEEKNQNMINVTAITDSPRKSADIANELARVFLDNYEKMRNRAVQKRYDYFAHQKIVVLDRLQKLDDEKDAYLAKHNVNEKDLELAKHLKDLSELEDKIIKAESQQNALEIELQEYKEKLTKLDREVKLSYEITTVDDTALKLKKNELASMRERFTDMNPKVKKLIAEVETMEKKLKAEKNKDRPPGKIIYGVNQQVVHLEDQIFRAETEIKSLQFALEKYTIQKPKLEKKIDELEKTSDDYGEIKRKIALSQELLKKIDIGVTEMGLALSSSVSDLRIFEEAEPPVYPAVDKRRKKLIFGLVIAVLLGIISAIIFEVVDLTVKSKFDIEHVMHIDPLGSLPRINEVKLKKFYSAVQIVFSKIFKADIDSHKKNVLIAFGDVGGETGKTFFIRKCIDVFGPMDKKILYISSCSELASGLVKYKINDYIYNEQEIDVELAEENNDHLYFLLDNYSYIVPMKPTQIEKFLSSFKDYDFIFWELFDFRKNEPLFVTICSVAQSTVLMAKFKKTKKLAMLKCVKHLKEHQVENIGGVVNSVERRYFNKGV